MNFGSTDVAPPNLASSRTARYSVTARFEVAVSSPERWPAIPETPTVAESGVPGYAVLSWYGWVYPAGTPQQIIDKTYDALKTVLARADVRDNLAKVGAIVHVTSPAEFNQHLADEVAKWRAVRDKAGLEPQ